jgi:hypothetical protein
MPVRSWPQTTLRLDTDDGRPTSRQAREHSSERDEMSAIVVYESIYGNTRAVAEAVAEGLGGAALLSVKDATGGLEPTEILVVGGPTHMHGLASTRSREMAVQAAHEDGDAHVKTGAADGPGLRAWLRQLSRGDGAYAASFDTRLDKPPALTGAAARRIARRLRHRGFQILGSESFLVEEAEGPLAHGELERARAWGIRLADEIRAREGAVEEVAR